MTSSQYPENRSGGTRVAVSHKSPMWRGAITTGRSMGWDPAAPPARHSSREASGRQFPGEPRPALGTPGPELVCSVISAV